MKKLKKKKKASNLYSKARSRIFEFFKSLTQKLASLLFIIFIFLLPTQFGKHFFPPFSYLNGVRVDYLAPTVYLTDIIIFFLIVFNLRDIFNFFKNKKLLFVLGLILINVFFAKNQLLALYRFAKVVEFFVVFSLAEDIFKKIKEKTLLITLSLSGIFQLFLVIFQLVYRHSFQGFFYFFGERLFGLSTPGVAKATLNGIEFLRPYGTFSHPNSLAGFFLLLYFFVLTSKNFDKYLLTKYFSLFIFSVLVFVSFSKIAIVTFLVLNTGYYVFNMKTKCFPCKITRIFIPFLISLIFLQATTDLLTVSKRIELIKNSFKIISTYPLLGVGLGNYLLVQASLPSDYYLFFNQPVHNIFLLFLSEMGVVITFFILTQFFKILKFLNIKKYWLIILSVLLTGMFDHYWLTLQQNFLLLAVVYGSVSKAFLIERLSLRS